MIKDSRDSRLVNAGFGGVRLYQPKSVSKPEQRST
jgi:hypothetical protein